MSEPRRQYFHRVRRRHADPIPSEQVVIDLPPTAEPWGYGSVAMMLFPVLSGAAFVGFGVAYDNPVMIYVGVGLAALMMVMAWWMYSSRKRSRKRLARRKRRRYREDLGRAERRLREIAVQQRRAAEFEYPDDIDLREVVRQGVRVWERRPADEDFLRVRLGRGPVRHAAHPRLKSVPSAVDEHDPELLREAEQLVARWRALPEMPCIVDLGVGVVAIVGPPDRTRAWARWAAVQLGAFRAPHELRLAVSCLPAEAEIWDWVKWLPHVNELDARGGSPCVAFTATADAFADVLDEQIQPRVQRLRRLRAEPNAPAVIDAPPLVLILDSFAPGDERVRMPLLRQALKDARALRLSVITLVARSDEEPSDTDLRVEVPAHGPATAALTAAGSVATRDIFLDAISPGFSREIARPLAALRLDEANTVGAPARTLLELHGLASIDALDVATAWRHTRDHALRARIGVADDGKPLEVDLKQLSEGGMGPHGVVIGSSGAGKSELLRTLITSLALSHSPEELNFLFIDFKGGTAFGGLEELPHCAGLVTDLEKDLTRVERARDALHAERGRRESALDAAGVDDVVKYRVRRRNGDALDPLPDLLIIIDEFAEVLAAQPDFLDRFTSVGRVGRGLGMHLLLSSQTFDEGRLGALVDNLAYRICLRTETVAASKAVLGTPDASALPPVPGLAYLKAGATYDRFQSVLVAREREPEADAPPPLQPFAARTVRSAQGEQRPAATFDLEQLHALVDALAAGAAAEGAQRAHRVWLDELSAKCLSKLATTPPWWERAAAHPPAQLTATIGQVDLPLKRRQPPLVLDFAGSDGHLAVVGSPQSGKSTVLLTVVLSLARAFTPEEVNFYVIDLGGGLRVCENLPHVGAVAGSANRDLVRQVVDHATALIAERREAFIYEGIDGMADARDRRARGEASPADVFLLIDGWHAFKEDYPELTGQIEEIVAGGLAVGVHAVVATNRWYDMKSALQDNVSGRLELRLNDPGATSMLGQRRDRPLPPDTPGRGLARDGVQMRVALPRLDDVCSVEGLGLAVRDAVKTIAARWSGEPAPQIQPLPLRLPRDELPAPDGSGIVLGKSEAGKPITLDLSGADTHLLIVGDVKSGRTNLLRVIGQEIAASEPPERAAIALVDVRRKLVDLTQTEHVRHYAATPEHITALIGALAEVAAERLEAGVSLDRHGKHIYLFIDDYDVLSSMLPGALIALESAVAHGGDIGLHVVLAQSAAEALRGAYEPFFRQLTARQPPAIILSGDPREGPVLYNHRAKKMPPGRGQLVRDGRTETIQTALARNGLAD